MPHVVKIFAAIEIPSVKLLGQCLWNCPASLPQPGKDPHILHAELHGVGFDEPYQDGNPEEETSWESGVGLQGSAPPRKCGVSGVTTKATELKLLPQESTKRLSASKPCCHETWEGAYGRGTSSPLAAEASRLKMPAKQAPKKRKQSAAGCQEVPLHGRYGTMTLH
eukprot:g19065.t2